jgi:hypothetical protein
VSMTSASTFLFWPSRLTCRVTFSDELKLIGRLAVCGPACRRPPRSRPLAVPVASTPCRPALGQARNCPPMWSLHSRAGGNRLAGATVPIPGVGTWPLP